MTGNVMRAAIYGEKKEPKVVSEVKVLVNEELTNVARVSAKEDTIDVCSGSDNEKVHSEKDTNLKCNENAYDVYSVDGYDA